mgnify:CR=1 FL=1
MLDNVGLRYPHRASGAKAPRTLRPLPLLRFAVSATGGAHLCSIQYYLRFWLSSCRTSLAVSALRIMQYCLKYVKNTLCRHFAAEGVFVKLEVGDIIAMRGQTLLHWTDESLIRYGYVENCCGIQGKSPLTAYRFRPLCAAFLWSLPKNQTNRDNRPNTAFFAAGFMVESMRTQKKRGTSADGKALSPSRCGSSPRGGREGRNTA